MSQMPAAEVELDEARVRRLLADQHPDLAGLPITMIGSGWDNAIFRLGDELCVRLPRRALAAPLIAFEQQWLPVLAPRLPVPVPVPIRVGVPSPEYPWAWSVCPWLDGHPAAGVAMPRPPRVAAALGTFVASLHRDAPPDAPENPYRGVPLGDRDGPTRERIEQLGSLIDGRAVGLAWATALATPPWEQPARWIHGDLHPANILLDDTDLDLVGVLDFGDLTSGDPATDLAVAWMLFDPDSRTRFRSFAGDAAADEDTWARARGWAVSLALAYLAHAADHPVMADVGLRTLDRVLAEP